MASITSVVAFFILLLATFSYSAPVGQEYGTSTPKFEQTTNQNMNDRQKPVNIRSMVNDESTSVPVIREDRSSEQNQVTIEGVTLSPRTFEDSSYSPMSDHKDGRSYVYSTNSPTSESSEGQSGEQYSTPSSAGMKPKRSFQDSTFPSTSESSEERKFQTSSSPSFTDMKPKRVYKESTYPSTSESSEERKLQTSSPLSAEFKPRDRTAGDLLLESSEQRGAEKFLYTTESSKEFNQRAIRPVESEQEVESSTNMDSNNQIKMNNDDDLSSSVHTFGKYTGLLAGEQSSTSESETTNQPGEESTQDSSVQPERLTKTVSIIPGKITETKIYANAPSKTSVIIQSPAEEQLSQVQN